MVAPLGLWEEEEEGGRGVPNLTLEPPNLIPEIEAGAVVAAAAKAAAAVSPSFVTLL